jgi:hypothetical protein
MGGPPLGKLLPVTTDLTYAFFASRVKNLHTYTFMFERPTIKSLKLGLKIIIIITNIRL